jgi:hypothetical protein
MFVAVGAIDRLRNRRQDGFREQYIRPLLREAAQLGIRPEEIATMITEETTS